MSWTLSAGRPLAKFAAPFVGEDRTYAAQRLDGSKIQGGKYQHCTFVNISFKEVALETGQFVDCIFVDCYFRRTQLKDCTFVGCRFIDCQFPHVSIQSCDFRYAVFRGCHVPFSEMQYSLPAQHNVREDLTRNLAVECARTGSAQESRLYRMTEVRAREEHLWAAVQGTSTWYQTHFDFVARIRALRDWFLSSLNRLLWGYGERSWVLLRNLLLASLVVFPICFYLVRDELRHTSRDAITIVDTLVFSLQNIVPAAISSQIVAVGPWAQGFATAESVFGIVALALLASFIFRWSLHR